MDCQRTRKKLNAYIDGELPAEEQSEIDRHLRDCPECVDEMVRRRELDRLLDEWEGIEAPSDFAASVRTEAERRHGAPSDKILSLPLRSRLARAAALLAIVAGVGLGAAASSSMRRMSSPGGFGTEPEEAYASQLLESAPPDSLTASYLQIVGEGGENDD